jgi:hypothetical protein
VKRSPLRRISEKRKAQLPARRRCIQIVLERDKVCQLHPRLDAYWREWGLDAYTVLLAEVPAPDCWGPLDVHEPGHRSQGADPTDPDQCVALARGCHDWVHGHPLIAKALTL